MARCFWITLVIAAAVAVAGCNHEATASADSTAASPAAAPAGSGDPAGSMPADGATTAATQAGLAAASGKPDSPTASGDFDPASVPVTSASLPPFPFFKAPEGLLSGLDEKDKHVSFDGQHFIAGDKVVMVEGKVFHDNFALQNGDRTYSEREFQKNYENVITALGGRKINTSQYTDAMIAAAGGRDKIEKNSYGAAVVPEYQHDSYLIRTPDKEYWIEISTGQIPVYGFVVVVERQAMAQSVGLLDAAAMKKAIDANGHVALYINFDIDKATLRPDAQPVIAEINKLLAGDPALRLSIQGHTDNTGTAAHNKELSAARARSVLGALVGLGTDASRLESKGLGQDQPIASNATEDGRGKNRRVELVKL
jgi:OOP family OmpA-OmpF porin